MARKKTNSRKKKNKQKRPQTKYDPTKTMNFLPEAGPGCHIVRLDPQNDSHAKTQVLGWDQNFDEEDFEGQTVPDICFDPTSDGDGPYVSSTLTLCNISKVTKVAYITVYEVDCFGRDMKLFEQGTTTDNEGHTSTVVTFIVLAPPMTFCTLCEMKIDRPPKQHDGSKDQDQQMDIDVDMDVISSIQIESDVQEWKPHPDPSLEYSTPLRGFPLKRHPQEFDTNNNTIINRESFLCTQGVHGQLTHYFLGNLHAVDFRCEVGTPLVAVEDGEIVQVNDGNTLTGICASNMFQWNSILVRHKREKVVKNGGEEERVEECGENGETCYYFTEYVHIQKATIREGDTVQRGDVIGYSGSVGFSPEPHLHFALYFSDESDALSVGFHFQGAAIEGGDCNSGDENLLLGSPYKPTAGQWCDEFGLRL